MLLILALLVADVVGKMADNVTICSTQSFLEVGGRFDDIELLLFVFIEHKVVVLTT